MANAVRAFVENELAHCSIETAYIHLDDLYVVLRTVMSPGVVCVRAPVLGSIVERLPSAG